MDKLSANWRRPERGRATELLVLLERMKAALDTPFPPKSWDISEKYEPLFEELEARPEHPHAEWRQLMDARDREWGEARAQDEHFRKTVNDASAALYEYFWNEGQDLAARWSEGTIKFNFFDLEFKNLIGNYKDLEHAIRMGNKTDADIRLDAMIEATEKLADREAGYASHPDVDPTPDFERFEIPLDEREWKPEDTGGGIVDQANALVNTLDSFNSPEFLNPQAETIRKYWLDKLPPSKYREHSPDHGTKDLGPWPEDSIYHGLDVPQRYYDPWQNWEQPVDHYWQGWKDEQIPPEWTAKTAAGQVMYHFAPREHRDSIMREGLVPKMPSPDLNNHEGVYLWHDLDKPDPGLSGTPRESFPTRDLYEVDVSGLPIEPDTWYEPGMAASVRQPIPPERLRRVSTHDNRDYVKLAEWDEDEEYERMLAWRSQNPRVHSDFRLDPESHCLGNTEALCDLDPTLTYQEGQVRDESSPTGWSDHAWATTPEGEIVDPYFEYRWPGKEWHYDPTRPWEQRMSSNDKTSMKLGAEWPTPPELPEHVRNAFADLASQQRGDPEQAMLRLQKAYGGGVGSYAAEHIGDLNHRMNEWAGKSFGNDGPRFGYEFFAPKVDKTHAVLHNPYGFEKEMEENIRENSQFYGHDEEAFRNELKQAWKDYALTHDSLPAYNRPQMLARAAASSLGWGGYGDDPGSFRHTRWALSNLKHLIDDPVEYTNQVTDYRLGPDGQLLQYGDWPERQRRTKTAMAQRLDPKYAEYLTEHIHELADLYGIEVHYTDLQNPTPIAAMGDIWINPIRDTYDYFVALHEVGHIAAHQADRGDIQGLHGMGVPREELNWMHGYGIQPELSTDEMDLEDEAAVWRWAAAQSKIKVGYDLWQDATKDLHSYLEGAKEKPWYTEEEVPDYPRTGPMWDWFHQQGENTTSAKLAMDWMGDSYPGEDHTEEKQINKDWTQLQFTEDPKEKITTAHWFMSGGYVKISDDDFDDLYAAMGHQADWKPLAYGSVDIYYNYEMMFHVEKTNMAMHLVEKRLKKYCTDQQLKYEGVLMPDGTMWADPSKQAGWEVTAEVPGVGRENPEKLWRMHMIDTQPVEYYGEQDSKIDAEPQGEMICPHCGEICDSYGDFLVHEQRTHSDGLGIPDVPQPVVDMDDPIPAHFNTNPDTRTDQTINRQASWREHVSAKMPLIPAPIPFIFDIEGDKLHSGQPGHRHHDIRPKDKLTPNVVEGLFLPDGKLQFRTDSTMPYSVRYIIRMWYTHYPELEVKHVEKLVGDKKYKLANANNIGGRVRDVAFTDQAANEVYNALHMYGDVFIVGGAVRDTVLGKLPKDIDMLAAGIEPESISTLLNTLPGRTDFTGQAFGVFRYKALDGSEVEIALPRTEVSTGAGHKDFQVQTNPYLSIEEDLARRDFTGNAMAVNMRTGELIDPYNGQQDLRDRKLRLVDPKAFQDDPLRILRAFAAISKQGVRPDDDTKKEIEEQAYRLRALPEERIQMELDKIMGGADPERAIRAMRDMHVLEYVLPEVAATVDFDQKNKHHRKTLDEHILEVVRKTAEESDDPDVRYGALFHDIGKPPSQWIDDQGFGHYYKKIHLDPKTKKPTGEESGADHAEVGAQMTHDLMTRLKYPNDRRDRVEHLVKHHMFEPFNTPTGAGKFLKRVGDEHAHDLLTLRAADQEGKGMDEWENQTPVSLQRQLVDQWQDDMNATKVSDLAINGNDLIKAGMQPGPEFSRILNKLLEAVIENPGLNHPETLLEMAHNYATMRDASVQSNILDPIREALDEAVFKHPEGTMPILKPKLRHWTKKTIYRVLRDNGYPDPEDWLHIVLTGSLTTYQWAPDSDFDIALFIMHPVPHFKRGHLISIILKYLEGVPVPGTTHELGVYLEPEGVKPHDIFRPGLRSAYDVDQGQWIVLPERERTIDVQKEMGNLLTYAKGIADKMRMLLLYDPPGAKQYWKQLQQRWRKDQSAGRGDYSPSNIAYKYLAKHHLHPELRRAKADLTQPESLL